MPDDECELCGDPTDELGWLLVNRRLFHDSLCESCQFTGAEDLADRLDRADVDEATKREAVRALITTPSPVAHDEPPKESVIEDVLDEVDVADPVRVQVLDAVETQDDSPP